MTFTQPVLVLLVTFLGLLPVHGQETDTLPALEDRQAPGNYQEIPGNYQEMWSGFDPRKEPLDIEILKAWEEDGVELRIVRFRIGVFKGREARLAAVYGYPKGGTNLPGLLQIHGGGQYADYKACLVNAKRGYATVSIAWAGRISAPDYRVTPREVQLFWDDRRDDPNYKLTTDWGAVDGYHAPGRNPKNAFPSAKPAAWTIDPVESPRNSGWFLCALAARRALTFLEQQSQVNPKLLGVYGHSMGGKLTIMTAPDPRVVAAAPSCGGISDRDNDSPLFRATLGDDVSLKQISCPVMFLSPANDFHGRIGDLPKAVQEISSKQWRVTCSPHHNHQDTAEYEVATLLWFDQILKGAFEFPQTPVTELRLETADGVPMLYIEPDRQQQLLSVDVYYTQHGKLDETSADHENTKHRFWHHAQATQSEGRYWARLPISSNQQPLWVYANVKYPLHTPVAGAGYYYRTYTANTFNLSSLLETATADQLNAAGVQATLQPANVIERFEDDWEKEWFTYKLDSWERSTHKLYDDTWKAPKHAQLALDVFAEQPNQLVILIDEFAAVVPVKGGAQWQPIVLQPQDFQNLAGETLADWDDGKRLTLSPLERLKSKRGDPKESRTVGQSWRGEKPRFRNLRWHVPAHVSKAD